MMGLFSKKKTVMPELPPPPSPPERKGITGDFEPIKPGSGFSALKEESKSVVVKPAPIIPPIPEASRPLSERSLSKTEKPPKPLFEGRNLPPPPRPMPEQKDFTLKVPESEARPLPELIMPAEQEPKVYDKTLKEALKEAVVESIGISDRGARPIFISSQDYKRILNDSSMIKARLLEAEEFINRLNTLKKQEDYLFEKWRGRLEDVERKITYVDSILSRAK